ncbi:MAG TPA: hypothetical protein VK209_02875 [Candidatus Sulfotelmatobacter sp.]|nr:hypothetical protein [Candidatus Sulfotelmatobacter sp.]
MSKLRTLAAYLRGLNLRSLYLYTKNCLLYRESTIQFLQKVEVYKLKNIEDAEQLSNLNYDETLAFLANKCQLHKTTGLRKSHSFVIQFLQLLEKTLAPSHTTYVLNRLGAYITNPTMGNLKAPVHDDKYGISIGIGTPLADNEDYVINTKIEHGFTSGKMIYNELGVGVTSITDEGYVELPILRTFYNRSGATITVKEICLTTGTSQYYLIARDSVDQAVENLSLLIVWYLLRTKV